MALEAQSEEDLLWSRPARIDTSALPGRVVVHGHTVSTDPERDRGRIGIDTGAFASGVLTCLVLEGSEQRFLAT